MTTFDTLFDAAAEAAKISWAYVYNNADRNIRIDREIQKYPCIFRAFSEPLLPLFDTQQRVQRDMLLYFAHVGFQHFTAEEKAEHIEGLMNQFITFRESLRSVGVEVNLIGSPFIQWEQTNLDEYGIVFNLSVKYSICQD
jgi:hypothetical protein